MKSSNLKNVTNRYIPSVKKVPCGAGAGSRFTPGISPVSTSSMTTVSVELLTNCSLLNTKGRPLNFFFAATGSSAPSFPILRSHTQKWPLVCIDLPCSLSSTETLRCFSIFSFTQLLSGLPCTKYSIKSLIGISSLLSLKSMK